MIAVVPVRSGALPAGGDEVVAECGGRAVLVGRGRGRAAAYYLAGLAAEATAWEVPGYAPGRVVGRRWRRCWPTRPSWCCRHRRTAVTSRPGWPTSWAARSSPAPSRVGPTGASVARHGGLVIEDVRAPGPFVATLQPGVRGVEPGLPAAVSGAEPRPARPDG